MFKVGDIVIAINSIYPALNGYSGKVLHDLTYDDHLYVDFGEHGSYYIKPELLRLDKGQMRKDKLNELLKWI